MVLVLDTKQKMTNKYGTKFFLLLCTITKDCEIDEDQ